MNLDGQPHGQGKLLYSPIRAGAYYEGAFQDGKRHGTGKLFESMTQSTYVGDWDEDLPHGFGHIEWEDAS